MIHVLPLLLELYVRKKAIFPLRQNIALLDFVSRAIALAPVMASSHSARRAINAKMECVPSFPSEDSVEMTGTAQISAFVIRKTIVPGTVTSMPPALPPPVAQRNQSV